jgi:Sec-independent protein translocase protein TatA
MTIGLGQVLVIILISLLLFGNFPNIVRDLSRSIKSLINLSNEKDSEVQELDSGKKQEKRDSNP